MLSVILLLTLSVPGTLGYFLSFDSGESCEANGCTTPSSAAECEEATVAAGTSHSTLPDGTRFRTWTFGSGARCNIQYLTYDGITSYAVTWATTGTLYSIGCSFNTQCVCKCQYPPPGPPSPPPVSPPETVMHPGPDGTFFVHGVYQAFAGVVVDGYQAFAPTEGASERTSTISSAYTTGRWTASTPVACTGPVPSALARCATGSCPVEDTAGIGPMSALAS